MPAATTKVKVTRAFLIKGERAEPGSVIELESGFAREQINLQRVEAVSDEPKPKSGPMTTATTPGIVSGAPPKGKADAK
jgi:hypothetical protein